MTVLTTVVSRPVNGRAAAAVEQLKQLQQTALDSGAERAAASRVITGPNVGTLQLRIFTESLTHAGEVSSKMWGSDVCPLSSTKIPLLHFNPEIFARSLLGSIPTPTITTSEIK